MRIIIDHQIFSSQKFGGGSRYFVELAKGLNKVPEVQIEIYAPLHCNNYLQEVKGFNGIKLKAIPKIYRFIQPIDHLMSKIHFQCHPLALVHETYYQYKSAVPKNCPAVVSAFDLIHEKYHENFRIKDETTLRKRAALRRATHVIAISESTRRDYIEYFNIPPDKITTVLLGTSFPIIDDSIRCTNSPQTRPYILFVGSRYGYKNFERVIEAYFSSRLLVTEFDLICFGGGAFTSQERNFIEHHGGSFAEQVNQISGSDTYLYEYYRHARMLVYPSLYEGFGLPPLEAMAAGCPVACTNTSSVPEVVGDAALMFNPMQVEEIRICLERIAFDSTLAAEMVKRGIVRARELNWKKCVEETVEVYRKILS